MFLLGGNMQICSAAPIAFSSRSEHAALILELNSLKVVSFKQFVLSAVEARRKAQRVSRSNRQ